MTNKLTDEYDLHSDKLKIAEDLAPYKADIIKIVDTIYSPKSYTIEDGRNYNIDAKLDENKLKMKEFKALWNRINIKSAYIVDFDTDELIEKSVAALNRELCVSQIFIKVEHGEMDEIKSKDELVNAEAFKRIKGGTTKVESAINMNIKYDLIGKIVAETGLTRTTVATILKKINKATFEQFHRNPEEFIIKSSNILTSKATVIIEHITYNKLSETYDKNIFTSLTLKR